MSTPFKKILILTANPTNTERLRLDEEVKQIKEGLRRANNRDQFEIAATEAVTIEALRRALLDHSPQIVHFSGHGAGEQGLALVGDAGKAKLVPSEALANLFALFEDHVECVVLNACYSEVQAKAITQHIKYVIGMNEAIGDTAARKFAVGFYDGLGAGRSIEFSYELGCNAIAMEGIREDLTPVLKQKTDSSNQSLPRQIAADSVAFQPVSAPLQQISSMAASEPVEVFFSYSHKDEDLRDKLANHLTMLKRQGVIKAWHDREISGGEEWAGEIDQAMNAAQIILLLVSDDFLASDYCYDIEMGRAMERHEAQEARVVPIILRPVDWSGAPFGKLQALPKNAKPVTIWENRDEAFLNIAQGIRKTVQAIRAPQEPVGVTRRLVLETPSETLPTSPTPESEKTPMRPVAYLVNPTGQVAIDSPFYIDRPPVELDSYRTIANPGALLLIKAPRQMGKTSLMSRILNHGKAEHNCRTVRLNFLEADNESLVNPEIFLKWFCSSVTYELDMEDKVQEYWKSVVGNRQKCTNYFQKYLLSQIDTPLILGLDEVDRLFDLEHFEVAEAFFSLLRAWHERKNEPTWDKLRLVLAHSQEVYISLNVNQSPFNVGQTVKLSEFNKEQVRDLVQRHELDWSDLELNQLMGTVDGHPYLLRIALYQIASGRMTLERLLELAPTQEGPFGDHLRHHLSNLNTDPKLKAAMRRLVTNDRPIELEQEHQFKLCSMGLAELRGNAVIPLCNLYRTYFCNRLKDD